MSATELERILAALDGALAVQRRNDGSLNATELSAKNMLSVVREYVANQLKSQTAATADESLSG